MTAEAAIRAVMSTSIWTRNQIAIKAAVNGYLNSAIRDIDASLVWMSGEHVGSELKAQGDELKAIKYQLLAVMAKPADAPWGPRAK